MVGRLFYAFWVFIWNILLLKYRGEGSRDSLLISSFHRSRAMSHGRELRGPVQRDPRWGRSDARVGNQQEQKKKKEHRVIFLCTLIAHNTIKFPEI